MIRTFSFLFFSATTLVATPATFPKVVQAGLAAPDILGITFNDGTHVRGGQEPYVAQPGDEIRVPTHNYTPANTPQLWRDGECLGWLVENRTVLTRRDKIVNSFPDTAWLDRPESFRIESPDDPRFAQSSHPARLSRKSMPHATSTSPADAPPPPGQTKSSVVRHTIYLHLDEPWKKDARYRISFDADVPPLDVTINDALPSEAIHATQLGFAPDDEPKVAFMSCWLGTGGALTQSNAPPFQVVNAAGEIVHRGTGVITKRADENESRPETPRNLNLTDVVMFDFSPVKTRGEYRVVVPGVGSSAPIRIADDVWLEGFAHVMKYFYFQRSGVEIRPPYAEFRRPRNFHPADGVKITQSTLTLLDSSNGLKAFGREQGSFPDLIAGDTGEVVGPDAWGGYADSGDWDRRILHLEAARLQLDLLLEGGEKISAIKLTLPESGNGLPDVLNVALWDLDFYRRMMTPEGGVRGGIESAEHPKAGEGSWQESLAVYAYAPDVWSSYDFAATAARCATFADGKYSEVAKTYRDAAVKAMNWAEAEWPRLSDYLTKITPGALAAVKQTRNLAAADLYRLTGEKKWEELFAQTLEPTHTNSMWVYLQTKRDRDPALVEKCRTTVLAAADETLTEQSQLGYRWTRTEPGAEDFGWGLFSRTPKSHLLLRAYQMTDDAKYRGGALLNAQMALGANPNNMTYISGLGHNPMRNIFHHDTKERGLEPPAGMVAFGPYNPNSTHQTFQNQIKRVSAHFVPDFTRWPQTEFCVDSGRVNPVDEHLPDHNGCVAYLYGSLARGPLAKP